MITIRKPRIMKQTTSEPPPRFVQMQCQCGQIFSQSLKLTMHMFEKHIYSAQFLEMKNMRQQQSTIGSLQKSDLNFEQQIQEKQQKYARILKDISLSCQVPSKRTKYKDKIKKSKQQKEPEHYLDQVKRLPSNNQNEQSLIDKKGSLQVSFPILSQTSNDKNNQKIKKKIQRKPKGPQVRQFHNSRAFMCGQCLIMFVYSVQLNVHVSVQHNGQYPDGTIFGLKKNQLLNFFKIPIQKPVYLQVPQRERKYKCGCGRSYVSTATLMNHIKIRHDSKVPSGTIDLPRGRRKKKLVTDNTLNFGF